MTESRFAQISHIKMQLDYIERMLDAAEDPDRKCEIDITFKDDIDMPDTQFELFVGEKMRDGMRKVLIDCLKEIYDDLREKFERM